MSNAEPDPSRPNGAASGSLGAMYETAVRHTIAMPNVAGTSIGSAYESWFEADQEAQWLRNLESTRSHASSDHTQVIDLGAVDAYRERREAEERTVSIRRLGSQQTRTLPLGEAVASFVAEATSPDLRRSEAVAESVPSTDTVLDGQHGESPTP